MQHKDIAAQLNISSGRLGHMDRRMNTLLHILLAGELLDDGQLDDNPKALRLLVAMCKNLKRKTPLAPATVMELQGLKFSPYGDVA
jgi:hypothetical protein